MKRLALIVIFNTCYPIFKTASPEMIPKHALVKGPIEILGKQKFGPLYLVLLRKGKREEAIRLVMPLSYEGFIESFYHGPLREMEVSIDEALKVLQESERVHKPENFSEVLYDAFESYTIQFETSKRREYGALFEAHCRYESIYNYQMPVLLFLKAAHEAGANLTFRHHRNFERKEKTVTFPALDIPLR